MSIHHSSNRDTDDEVEIEFVHAPAPPRRPRASNPAVDEVIQSGEIVEPRSHIVRSSNSLPAFQLDQPALRSAPEFPTAPTSRAWRYVLVVGALLAAAASIGLTLMSKPSVPIIASDSQAKLQTIADMIGTTLDGDARAAFLRAQAIASSPMLRAGIATDAQTLADMVRDKDLLVTVEGAEVIEVFQVRDGVRTLMLRVPADAAAIPTRESGQTWIEADGATLTVVATAEIPKQRSDVSGEVRVSVPVDFEPIKKRGSGVALRATVTGFGAPIVLVANPGTAGAAFEIPIKTNVQHAPIALIAAPPTLLAANTELLLVSYGCMGLAGLLTVIFVIVILRSRR